MKKTLIWVAGALALVLLIAGAYILYNKYSEEYAPDRLAAETAKPDKTNAAPDFTVVDNAGNVVKLSDMKGKPVVVNFWASWCPPCKQEMPDFEEMYKKYGSEINFMMINMTDGEQETEEKAKAHIAENAYTFSVYYDTEMSAAIAYQVTSIPATYFIDADGNLVTYANGMINAATLEKGIDLFG